MPEFCAEHGGTGFPVLRWAFVRRRVGFSRVSTQSAPTSRVKCNCTPYGAVVRAGAVISGGLPWKPGSADPPVAVIPGGWHYFTPQEAKTVEAFVDRLIPPDPETPGGKDLGCAVYIDRQLAGPQGRYEGFYMMGPVPAGYEATRPAVASYASAAIPQGAGRDRRGLPRQIRRQGFRRPFRRAEGRGHQRPRGRLAQARRRRQPGFFQAHPSGHAIRLSCRPDLRRQQGHGRMEDDRISRARITIIATGSIVTTSAFPLPPVGINNHPNWSQ